jgi:Flp pilus assembly pilin Flp
MSKRMSEVLEAFQRGETGLERVETLVQAVDEAVGPLVKYVGYGSAFEGEASHAFNDLGNAADALAKANKWAQRAMGKLRDAVHAEDAP